MKRVAPYTFLLSVLFLFAGCSPKQKEKQTEQVLRPDTTTAVQPQISDPFLSKIDSISSLFSELNFDSREESVLNDSISYTRHWWLKKYRGRPEVKPGVPRIEDYQVISRIRQFHFGSGWKYVIEEWQLTDEPAGERWYQLAIEATTSPTWALEKPPNVFWKEGDKLYFIMSTAANIWFEYGDRVIEEFTGKTKLELMEEVRRRR